MFKFLAVRKKVGNTDPKCPYCGHEFEKMPGRKRKCPGCDNYFCVRTRPVDRKRVLVTEAQKDLIEEQWAIKNGTFDQLVLNKRKFELEKRKLAKKFGKEPSDADVHWSLLNDQLLEHSAAGNWGTYRCTKFEMAELLRKENRFNRALQLYLEVCYLDLNGPRNLSGDRRRKPFSSREGFVAPGVYGCSDSMIEKLDMDAEQVHLIFIGIAERLHRSLKLPVDPQKAWKKMKPEIFL